MSVGHIAKTIAGTVALGATTALGFLPHDDPWFNVLTGVVAALGAYGVYAIPNKVPTPQDEAIGAAVGAVASDVANHFLPAQDAPAKTFPAAAVSAAVTASTAPAPVEAVPVETVPVVAPVSPAPVAPVAPVA